MSLNLSPSQEDYLEAILALQDEEGVGIQRIARHLGVAKPSVTAAVKRLTKMGLVKHNRYDSVTFTTSGKRAALKVAKRHALLKRFLTDILKVSTKVAEKDACAIEHHVSDQTVAALLKYLKAKNICWK